MTKKTDLTPTCTGFGLGLSVAVFKVHYKLQISYQATLFLSLRKLH